MSTPLQQKLKRQQDPKYRRRHNRRVRLWRKRKLATDPVWAAQHRERTRVANSKAKPPGRKKNTLYTARYRRRHRARTNAAARRYRRSTPHRLVTARLRSRLGNLLRACDARKGARLAELIGCPIPQLLKHIEARFATGMNWRNYGRWHIDHKRPCALFDLSNPTEQRRCFHWTNLQPLWAKENVAKGARF